MAPLTVKTMWKNVEQKKVCDNLFTLVMKDDAMMAYFKGVSQKKQSALFCAFVSTVMDAITLPEDDSQSVTTHFKQLASFHSGMGVGAGMFISFEYYLIKSFEKSMKLSKDMKNSLVNALHTHFKQLASF